MAILRRMLLSGGFAAGLALLAAGPALAHHGWSWTEDGFFELEGIIKEIYIGNPHATLDVDVEGEIWRVELAPPSATIARRLHRGCRQGRRRGDRDRQPLAATKPRSA